MLREREKRQSTTWGDDVIQISIIQWRRRHNQQVVEASRSSPLGLYAYANGNFYGLFIHHHYVQKYRKRVLHRLHSHHTQAFETRRCLMNFLFASTMANFSLFTATKQAKNHSRYNLPLAAIMDSSRVIYSQTISYILSPLFAWAAAGKWQTFWKHHFCSLFPKQI